MGGGRPKAAMVVGKAGSLTGGQVGRFDDCLEEWPDLPQALDVEYGTAAIHMS